MGCAPWTPVDQARIDAFAQVSGDRQFIHTDPERAARTPFGGTIAHGMLTLSMVSGMAAEVLPDLTDQRMVVNYGLDQVRFVAPVPCGARIRARFTLSDVTPRGRGHLMARYDVVCEIEDAPRPAMTAVWLLLYTV